MKFADFCLHFSSVELLPRKIGSNFTNLPLKFVSANQFVVLELLFTEACSGGITLSCLTSGRLRVHLYQESTEAVLRLVGKAAEKKSEKLFFECLFSVGKYVLFVECEHKEANVSYFGSGRPSLRVKEFISVDGLRNDFSEYVAIPRFVHMESRLRKPQNEDKEPSEKLTLDYVKNHFIRYLVEHLPPKG